MEHTGPGSRTVVSFKAPASSSDHRGACLASARYGDAAEGVRSACILSAHAYLCQRMRISTCERRREVPASRWRVIRCALTRCAARRRAVDLGRHGACTRGIGRAWSRDTWTTALVASNAQVGPFGRADAAGCATAMGVDNKRSRRVTRTAHRRTQEHAALNRVTANDRGRGRTAASAEAAKTKLTGVAAEVTMDRKHASHAMTGTAFDRPQWIKAREDATTLPNRRSSSGFPSRACRGAASA